MMNSAFARLERAGEQLRCGAGAPLKVVAQFAREAGLGGLEFLEGIPGSLGGAMRMNAGAMGWINRLSGAVLIVFGLIAVIGLL